MSNRSYSALTLLAVAGLASSLIACSKEEEKKAAWNCHSADVPQGEVLRCTSAALTEDGTSQTNLTTDGYTGTTTVGGAGGTAGSAPVGTDGTSATGTATGGTGSTTDGSGTGGGTGDTGTTTVGTDGTSAIGAGSGYGSGSYVPGAGSTNINSDATSATGITIYECFPGDTNPDCPPADAYDGMATGGSGGTSTGASLNSDGTASTGDGTATGGAGSTTGSGTQGTTDGTSATGSTTGGAGSTTGTGGSGTGGGNGGSTDGTALNSDGTSSTGSNGNGNGGGAGSGNKYPGPDECAYVPDLPYCAGGSAGNSSDGTPGAGGAAGGATASTPEGATTSGTTDGTSSTGTKGNGNGNGNGGTGGNGSKSGTTGTSGTGGTGDTGDTTGTTGTTGGTTDGTASNGPTGGGSTGGSSSTTGGGGSSGSSKPIGKHYKCVKDGKGNKSCESIPDCPTGSVPSGGACIDNGSSNGGTGDGTNGGSTPSGSSTPGGSEVQRPSEGGCWVTGGGFIISKNNLTGAAADGHDNYGGNAKPMKDGRIQGHWNHVDHGTGNHAKGRPEYIVCRKIDSEPGPAQPGCKKGYCMNQVYFGGHAEWRDHSTGVWESGYWFDVVAKDHGEPGSEPKAKNEFFPDTYHFTIRKMDDANAQASGTVVYEVGRDSIKGGDGVIVGGNIQIHPPNNGHPYTVNTLPSWVTFENPAQ